VPVPRTTLRDGLANPPESFNPHPPFPRDATQPRGQPGSTSACVPGITARSRRNCSALRASGVPILDAVWIIVYRVMKGRSPFLGDRAHLHHRLLDLGLRDRQIVFLFYLVTAVARGLALLVPSRLLKLYLLALLGVVGLGGLIAVAQRPPPGRHRVPSLGSPSGRAAEDAEA